MLLILWLCAFPLIWAMAVPPPTPLESPVPVPPPPNTIIDFLSANVEYSYFLRHIQRLGLVPKINKMANVTLFAPINLAFVDSEIAAQDTADSLLRYFVQGKFRVESASSMVTVLDSMYKVKDAKKSLDTISFDVFRDPDDEEVSETVDSLEDIEFGPVNENPDTSLLNTEDFKQEEKRELGMENTISQPHYFPLLISHQQSPSDGANLRINGISEIVEFDNYVKHQRSYIHGIDRLLPTSPSMCSLLMGDTMYLENGSTVSFIGKVFKLLFTPRHLNAPEDEQAPEDHLPTTCEEFLENVSTLLLPTDDYINSTLLEVERRYYTAILHGLTNPELYPTKDGVQEMRADAFALILKLLLPDQVLESGGNKSLEYPTIDASHSYSILANSSSGQIKINEKLTSLKGYSFLAVSDGLVHVFDIASSINTPTTNLTNPADFFSALGVELPKMIPRKALYAMHFSQMVSEIKFRKLGKLIGAKASDQTILIDMSDRDDVKEDDDIEFELSIGISSFTNRQQLLYKFLSSFLDMESELSSEEPIYHELLDSKLCLKKRIGSCYKTKVWGVMSKDKKISVSFNDVFLAGLPVIAANSNAIYFSDKDYEAPVSFKKVMAGLISDGLIRRHWDQFPLDKDACLETLKYLDSFDLTLLDDNRLGYTAFLPCGLVLLNDRSDSVVRENVWQQLGLVLKYLQQNPHKFKNVLKGMFLEDMVYSHPEHKDSKNHKVIKSLSGRNVDLTRSFDGEKVSIKLNDTKFSVALNSDTLFNQGIVHITDQVLLPSDFRVTLKELIGTTEEAEFPETSFFRLLEKLPAVEDKLNLELENPEYSIFVPTPDSLHWKNITANYRRLDQLLQMHTIPNSELKPLLDCISGLPAHVNSANYTFRTNRTNAYFRCQINPATGKAYLTLQKQENSFSTQIKTQRVTILSHGCTQGIRNGSCVFLIDNPISPSWFDIPDNFLYVHIGWISVGIGIIIGVILFGFCTTTLVLCLSTTGQKRKAPSHKAHSQSSLFAPTETSYMRITSDEDLDNNNYDYGYETDNDMMGDEEQGLLPKRGKKTRKGVYGSMSPMGTPSAPLMIDRENLKKAFNRERNLPGLKL